MALPGTMVDEEAPPLPEAPQLSVSVSVAKDSVDDAIAAKSAPGEDGRYHPVSANGAPVWPRKVGIGMKVEKVLRVDNVMNTFEAAFKASYEWQLTQDEYDDYLSSTKNQKWRPRWQPAVDLPLAQRVEKSELPIPHSDSESVFSVFDHEGKAYTIVYIRYRCIFSEVYELQNFPFDCQDLTFILESQDATKATLHPRFKRNDFVAMDMENCQLPDWDFCTPVLTIQTASEKSRSGTKRLSRFVLSLKIKRRSNFYVNRIMHTAALLCGGSLLTWSIDVHMPHRLILCFTIILTVVTFQMAIASKLPQVRYFTLLDIYLVLSQRFVFMTAVEHAILKTWFMQDDIVDKCCFSVTLGLFILMQAGFVFIVWRRSAQEEEKLTLNGPQLEEWLSKRRQAINPGFKNDEMMISKKGGQTGFLACGSEYEMFKAE